MLVVVDLVVYSAVGVVSSVLALDSLNRCSPIAPHLGATSALIASYTLGELGAISHGFALQYPCLALPLKDNAGRSKIIRGGMQRDTVAVGDVY